jgi:hypothetical protein
VVNSLVHEQQNGPPFRIFGRLMQMAGMHSPNYYAMFGIQSADGHHNNELQTYELFKGGRPYSNYTMHWFDDFEFNQEGIPENNFLKVAGVRYIVLPNQEGASLLENPGALERAYMVHDCVVVDNDTLAVQMLKEKDFDPSQTAIIDRECDIELPGTERPLSSTVNSITYIRDTISMTVEAQAPGLLILTENHVPYWHASVDGEQVTIYRAYGTFMAIPCDSGRHEVMFTFRSAPYQLGKKLTSFSLLFIIGVFAIFGIREGKKRMKSGTTAVVTEKV